MPAYHEEQVRRSPETGRTTIMRGSARWLSPGCILAGAVGLFSAIVGIVVIVRTGIDGTLNIPLTSIFGTYESAFVGIGLLLAGLVLLASAASEASRPLAGGIGVVMVILGVIGAASGPTIRTDVGFDKGAGWMVLILGAIALFAALLPSRYQERHEIVEEQTDLHV